ncbi:kinase-like protein [Ceratobasidium sp. AG-I]|nr:kinase-like protein [Ceratobasidium sp. AG-I]
MGLVNVNLEDSLEPVLDNSDGQFLCRGAASNKLKKTIRVSVEDFQEDENVWITFQKEFHQKTQLWSTLLHASLVHLEVPLTNDLVILSEYYPRGDLRSYVKTGLSEPTVYFLIKGIFSGLNYLHSHTPPIVHGNINAGKIFIDNNGSAIVGEFGLAVSTMEFPHLVPAVSHTGLVRWLSPEMFGGREQIVRPTIYSDIWSLGCTLFEVVAGKLPYFQYKHDVKVTQRILSGDLPGTREDTVLPTSHPAGWEPVWEVIDACWCPTPPLRPRCHQLATSGSLLISTSDSPWSSDPSKHDVTLTDLPDHPIPLSYSAYNLAASMASQLDYSFEPLSNISVAGSSTSTQKTGQGTSTDTSDSLGSASIQPHKKLAPSPSNKTCLECGKKFDRLYLLGDHMCVHTGVKEHICPSCGSCYANRSNLKRHYRQGTCADPGL